MQHTVTQYTIFAFAVFCTKTWSYRKSIPKCQ